MAKRRKPKVPGLDPIYVLAVKPKRGQRPTKFLADARAFPGEGPDTTQPIKARKWADSSGPRHYFRLHPNLRKRYQAYRVHELLLPPGESPQTTSAKN
jgi:hypothetical protein